MIELDTTIPPAHQARYWLNSNDVAIIKQDINKLITAGFIKPVEETIWLSLIVVVSKKNGRLKIYVDFKKFNATKKDPYPLPFMDEVINIVVGHEVYTFSKWVLKISSNINYIKRSTQNCLCDRLGGFCVGCDAIWCQKWIAHLS
jgi:hypothetical protein